MLSAVAFPSSLPEPSPSPRNYARVRHTKSPPSSSAGASPLTVDTSAFTSTSLDTQPPSSSPDIATSEPSYHPTRIVHRSRTTTKTERTWRYSVPLVEGEDLDRPLLINWDGDRKSTVSFSNTAEVRVGLGLGDVCAAFEASSEPPRSAFPPSASSSSQNRRIRPISTSVFGDEEQKWRGTDSTRSLSGSWSLPTMTAKRQPKDSQGNSSSCSTSSSRRGGFSRLWSPSSSSSGGNSSPLSASCSSDNSSPRLPAFKQSRSQEVTVASKVLACTAVAAFALCTLVGLLVAGYGLTAWDDMRRRLWIMKRGVKGAIGASKEWMGDAKGAVEEAASGKTKRRRTNIVNSHRTHGETAFSSSEGKFYGRYVPSHVVEPFDIDGQLGSDSASSAPVDDEYGASSSSSSSSSSPSSSSPRQKLPPRPPLMTLLGSLLFTLCVVCGRGVFVWWAQKRVKKRSNTRC